MPSPRFQQPFWPATGISGVFVLLVTIVLATQHTPGRAWLALIGVLGLLALAHGLAWWQAYARQQFRIGLWLIVGAQLLGAAALPVFAADAWVIGVTLLTVVPLEAGVVDQVRRMPLFALLALLGAAAVIGIDLLALPGRPTLFTIGQGTVWAIFGLIVLHLIGLVFILWYFRLRAGTSHYLRLDLTTQLAFVFTVIAALSILTVTGVLIFQIRQSQIQEVGRTFKTTTETVAERVGNLLEMQINALNGLVRQEPDLVNAVAAANARYPASKAAIGQFLRQQEQRWQSNAETSEFVLQHRSGPALLLFNAFRGQNSLHNHFLVTDREGGLVFVQGPKPTSFVYRDQDWWQAAWNSGQGDIFLGHLTIDPKTNVITVLIALRVIDPKTNEPIGVLSSTYQLGAVQQLIDLANEHTTQEVFLFAPDGTALGAPDKALIGQPAWPALRRSNAFAIRDVTSRELVSDWLLGDDRQGQPAVLAYSNLNDTSQINLKVIRRLDWRVIVSDTQADALGEVNRSTKVASLVGLLTMVGVLLVAMVIAGLITRPIEALTATAAAIKDGNLNTHAEPIGSVELVTLAQTFNSMAERLQKAFQTLQASEAKYRSLFEDSKDAIFITSMDGRLVDLNPAGLTLLDLRADEIQALNVADFYAVPGDRRRFREEIEQYQAVSDFEVTLRRHDGSEFAALITATIRYAEEGSVVGYQGIIRDITVQKHNERLQAENLRLSTELEVTQRLQRMLLPKQHELLAIDGLDIAGYMQPADEVGGDYYDVLRHNEHVKIGIGDVTGHGLESGVLMLMTQMGVRTLLTHNETNPVQFIDVLNRTIYDNVQRMEIDKNLTLTLLDYVADPHNGGGQLKASGQHEELIVVRQGGQVELVNTLDLGFPIGLDNDIASFVNQITLELQPGDGVVLYTDGITEAENLAGEQYGLERLCAIISQRWAEPADAIKEAVIADVRDFIGTQTVFDDITLLVLKQK